MDTVFFINDNVNAAFRNRSINGQKNGPRPICSTVPADQAENRVYVFYTSFQAGDSVDIVFLCVYN